MKFIEVPGWELKNNSSYSDEKDIVFLFTPLHQEKLGLDFSMVNIIPPVGRKFWSFELCHQVASGSRKNFQKFLNDDVKNGLRDVLDFYWDGDISRARPSMDGAMRYFGDEFESHESTVTDRDVVSIAIPVGSEEIFFDFFSEMEFYLGESAFAILDENDVLDSAFMVVLRSFLIGDAVETPVGMVGRGLSGAEKMYIKCHFNGVANFWIGRLKNGEVTSDFYEEKAIWVAKNLTLRDVEICKSAIDETWHDREHVRFKNRMRRIFDERLLSCPARQTNPYEDFEWIRTCESKLRA